MILFVKAVERAPVDAEQGRLPVRFVEPAEVDQQAHDAIGEAMAHRSEPRMHHVTDIECCGVIVMRLGRVVAHGYSAASANSGGASRHGATAPSASATASPDLSPSSWKPYPVQAPQNQVWRWPWISDSRFCAAKAAALNCG